MVQHAASRLSVDGGRGFGQVVGMRMVDALIPLARSTGIAMANGRHLGHTGRIGAYPEALAEGGPRRDGGLQRRAVGPLGGGIRRARRTHIDKSDRGRLAGRGRGAGRCGFLHLLSRRRASSA